ncbi:MAG: DNA/RNA non-specific endonuclease, partial [Chloroflexaceae bacterium]|nr:DNA/RNA non-specific endonuclease [Chloroflexaceae bacterium]
MHQPLKNSGRRNRIAVPEKYYKVIYDLREPEKKAIGFILPNEGSQRPESEFAVSVDEVERQTGLDFFPKL